MFLLMSQRSLMKALQTLFCPSPSSGAWAGSGEVGAAITYRCCCFGSELVSRLLGLLSEGAVAASLLANIADTLQAIITACCVRFAHLSVLHGGASSWLCCLRFLPST